MNKVCNFCGNKNFREKPRIFFHGKKSGAMYKVCLHRKAVKYYQALDDKSARRINEAIEKISQHPYEGSHIKKLSGRHLWKLRYAVGDLRIVYHIYEDDKTVLVEAIGPRGDIYK